MQSTDLCVKSKAVGFSVHACGCIIEVWHEMACKVKYVLHDFIAPNAKHRPLCEGLRFHGLVFRLVGTSLKASMNGLQGEACHARLHSN